MKLEDIGFYTLSDYRARQLSFNSPLYRCELILTNKCNFKCPYCRGLKTEYKNDMTMQEAKNIIDLWAYNKLKNIRFSGGEPTLWNDIIKLVDYAKSLDIKRIAISTNGSADFSIYQDLYKSGVNDFSISLDACCSSTGKLMNGGLKNIWEKVIENIKSLSKLTYVTVGVVLTENNIKETLEIIKLADSIGVSDIRIIPSAQYNQMNEDILSIDSKILSRNPILKYRVNNIKNNKNIRGITNKDCRKCFLVLDDMAIVNKYHYPCIIYLREQGNPIGCFGDNVREQRIEWFKYHDSFRDKICRNNCLDVCVDYNNKVSTINKLI